MYETCEQSSVVFPLYVIHHHHMGIRCSNGSQYTAVYVCMLNAGTNWSLVADVNFKAAQKTKFCVNSFCKKPYGMFVVWHCIEIVLDCLTVGKPLYQKTNCNWAWHVIHGWKDLPLQSKVWYTIQVRTLFSTEFRKNTFFKGETYTHISIKSDPSNYEYQLKYSTVYHVYFVSPTNKYFYY